MSIVLGSTVAALRVSRETTNKVRFRDAVRELPSRSVLIEVVRDLGAALFPTHYGRHDLTDESIDFYVGNVLNTALVALTEQVRRGLRFLPDPPPDDALESKAADIVDALASELPHIRALLVSDLNAAFQGDPAATSISEILLCYPTAIAVIHHRIAHALYRLGAGFVARLIASIAHSATGIDIHPGASIGPGFFIDHGTGVVIGETALLGANVRLYQAVTLGAKSFPVDENGSLQKGIARHPILEDDVVVYAGATVLGRVRIGRGTVIGGNVWLTHDVPPGSTVTQGHMRFDQQIDAAAPSG